MARAIILGHGIVTPDHKSADELRRELDAMALLDLSGKTVFDIGGRDGYSPSS